MEVGAVAENIALAVSEHGCRRHIAGAKEISVLYYYMSRVLVNSAIYIYIYIYIYMYEPRGCPGGP